MKLINESNWKQEVARLKAERIVAVRCKDREWDAINSGLCYDEDHSIKYVNYLNYRIEQIDKAIETIENVFVHKQCYIDY